MTRQSLPDLNDFIAKDITGAPILKDEKVQYVISGGNKTKSDLLRVLAKNVEESVLVSFWDSFQQGLQQAWAKECLSVEQENGQVARRNLEIQDKRIEAEKQGPIPPESQEFTPLPYPTFPERPVVAEYSELGEWFKDEPQYRTWRKLNGFEFNGVMCSVTEQDQNGWTSIDRIIEKTVEAGGEFSPVPFNNENGNVCLITSMEDWNTFYLTAWAARQAFFAA